MERLVIELRKGVEYKIVACVQQPQVVVRVATWLGIIGVALGVVGLLGLIK